MKRQLGVEVKITESMTLEQFLKKKRIQLGVSQDQLGVKIGNLNGQAVSNWEHGKCTVPAKHFRAIARVLHTSIETIIELRLKDIERELREVSKRGEAV